MDDQSELYWRYLKDNLDHSRHHESMRATMTNIVLSIAGVGFSVAGFDKCLSISDLPILIFIFLLGVFGALFTAKQTERASLHYQRARELRDAIDSGPHAPAFKVLKRAADNKHNPKYPWLSSHDLRSFWISLHILISILAIIVSIFAFNTASCPIF